MSIDLDIRAQIAAAQDQIHQAAEAIRALPDAELIALLTQGPREPVKMVPGAGRPPVIGEQVLAVVTKKPSRLDEIAARAGVTHLAAKNALSRLRVAGKVVASAEGWALPGPPAKTAQPKRTVDDVAKKHVPASPKQAKRANPPTDEALEARRGSIVRTLQGRDWTSPKELGDELGFSRSVVRTDLRALVSDGAVEHNGENSKLARYRIPGRGRQTGAKAKPKAPRAPKASDEEEGGVKLDVSSAIAPAPLPVFASAAIHRAPTSLLSRPRATAPSGPFTRGDEPTIASVVARAHVAEESLAVLPPSVHLEVGFGDRRNDCVHFSGPDGCLTRFVKRDVKWADLPRAQRAEIKASAPRERGDVPGRCPAACPHYRPPSRADELAFHMRGGRSALALAATN